MQNVRISIKRTVGKLSTVTICDYQTDFAAGTVAFLNQIKETAKAIDIENQEVIITKEAKKTCH